MCWPCGEKLPVSTLAYADPVRLLASGKLPSPSANTGFPKFSWNLESPILSLAANTIHGFLCSDNLTGHV